MSGLRQHFSLDQRLPSQQQVFCTVGHGRCHFECRRHPNKRMFDGVHWGGKELSAAWALRDQSHWSHVSSFGNHPAERVSWTRSFTRWFVFYTTSPQGPYSVCQQGSFSHDCGYGMSKAGCRFGLASSTSKGDISTSTPTCQRTVSFFIWTECRCAQQRAPGLSCGAWRCLCYVGH